MVRRYLGAGSAIAGRVCWCLVLGYLDSNSVKDLVCTEYSRTEDRVLEPIWVPRCLLRYSVPVYLYLLHSRQIPAYYLVLVCRGCHSATSGCRRVLDSPTRKTETTGSTRHLHVLSGGPQRVRNRGARAPGLVRCSPGSRCSADASTDAVAGPVLGQETSWTPGLPYITYIQYCIKVAS